MGLLKIALKVAEPLSLIAVSAVLCFLYFRSRFTKSLQALEKLPPEHRQQALEGFLLGFSPSLLKGARPDQLEQLTTLFKSRQKNLRIIAGVVCAAFVAVFLINTLSPSLPTPPPKPSPPVVAELTCAARTPQKSAPLLKIALPSLPDADHSFRIFARASRRALLSRRLIGEIEILSPSTSAEFFIEPQPVSARIFVKLEYEDRTGKVRQRSDPATAQVTSLC